MSPAATNGLQGPTGYAKMRKLLQQYEEAAATATANADALRRVLGILGESATESAYRRADATLAGALKIEQARRGPGHPWTTPDELDRRRRIVVAFLARHPRSSMRGVMGELKHRGIELTPDQTRNLLIKLRPEVVRIGDRTAARYQLATHGVKKTAPPPKATKKTKPTAAATRRARRPERRQSASFDGTTAEKARVIATIIRDSGGVMNIKDLVNQARAAGVNSLTGMVNYTRAGWLKRTRDRKGASAYRLIKMPPGPTVPADSRATADETSAAAQE